MRDLEPSPLFHRYEHAAPRDLLHLNFHRLVSTARPSHRITGDQRDTVKGIAAQYIRVVIKPGLSEAEGTTRASPSRLVRRRLAAEIDAHKAAHRRRLISASSTPRIGQAESLLKEVDPQHPLDAHRRTALA